MQRKLIHYRIGRRNGTNQICDKVGRDNVPKTEIMSTTIRFKCNFSHELVARHRHRFNSIPECDKADLAAVLCRLGASTAYYTVHGTLTTAIMRGGHEPRVWYTDILVDPLPREEHVYVPYLPHLACSSAQNSAFIALVNAVNGEGALVLTDAVSVNPDTGAAMVEDAAGATLAEGCLHAAKFIMNMYSQSGQAALAAFAFTKGVMSMLTVPAHTDEGATSKTCGAVTLLLLPSEASM